MQKMLSTLKDFNVDDFVRNFVQFSTEPGRNICEDTMVARINISAVSMHQSVATMDNLTALEVKQYKSHIKHALVLALISKIKENV
jgi:hypothetical protein